MSAIAPTKIKYRIQDDSERWLWFTFLTIIFLTSLLGDSIILLASVKRNAFKLNRLIVVIIQHIAVGDLLRSISFVFPTALSLATDGWDFGRELGYLTFFLNFFSYEISNIFLSVLTSTKLLLLIYPIRSRAWTKNGAHVVCGCVWTFAFGCAVMLIAGHDTILFNYISYMVFLVQTYKIIPITYIIVATFLPTFLVIISTLPTLHFLFKASRISHRVGGQRKWQGMVTVTVTAAIHCLLTIPNMVVVLVQQLGGIEEDQLARWQRVARFITALNVTCNFNIYCLTITSFREFVLSKIRDMAPKLARLLPFKCCQAESGDNHREGGAGIVIGNEIEMENEETDRPTLTRVETAASNFT